MMRVNDCFLASSACRYSLIYALSLSRSYVCKYVCDYVRRTNARSCGGIFLTLIMSVFIASADANVTVKINSEIYSYVSEPRLLEVLEPVALKQNWYWPSAKLFRAEQSAVQQRRNEIFQHLSELSQSNADKSAEFETLIGQLRDWQLAERVLLNIDFELTRFSLQHNPKFESGAYLMSLTSRPNTLYVFGAVNEDFKLPLPNNQCLRDTLAGTQKLSIADKNVVYLILPSGSFQKVPIAYWNHQCVIAPPGALIYVPIAENQWSEQMSSLNQSIASLAKNRLVQL